MHTDSFDPRGALLAAAGPAALGACLGMPRGLGAMFEQAASLPAIFAGTTLITLPALYIGAAVFGVAPSARRVAASAAEGLAAAGLAFLGLAPALLFLLSTSVDEASALPLLLGTIVAAIGAFFGLRAFHQRLFAGVEQRGRAFAVFAGWSLVAAGIGARLFLASFGGAS